MDGPPSVASDDTSASDVSSLRFVFGKIIEEISIMDREMEALKSNTQSLKGELKQLYVDKEFNVSEAANLNNQIDLLSQHEKSLSQNLTKYRQKINRDRELESSLNENLRTLRLSDLEKMTKCNQDVEKCVETMESYKELYAELPWVREKVQKLAKVTMGKVMSAKCKQLVKEVAAENSLMSQINCKRRNADICKLSRLMVKWKVQVEQTFSVESSLKSVREEVMALSRRKKEISESVAAKTQSIIHDIVGRTGSGQKRRAISENSLKPSKAPSLRELLGIRKLQEAIEIARGPFTTEGENVETPPVNNADRIDAPAKEQQSFSQQAEESTSLAIITNGDHASPTSTPTEKPSVTDTTLLPSQTGGPGSPDLPDTSEEVVPSLPEATPKKSDCSVTQKQLQSLRAILKPPPTIDTTFSPSPEPNQPVPINPSGTVLSSGMNSNIATTRTVGRMEIKNTESFKDERIQMSSVGTEKPSLPQLNWAVQIIASPATSNDVQASPVGAGVMEGQSAAIAVHDQQEVNVIELSDSGDSGCSEAKIPKIGPITKCSPTLAPKTVKLPQQVFPQKKSKKVSFMAKKIKDAEPRREVPRKTVDGSTSPETSHLVKIARQAVPLKVSQQANIPVVPTTSPQAISDAPPVSKVRNNDFDTCFGDIFGQGPPQTLAGPSASLITNSGADFFSFGSVSQANTSEKPISDFFSFF